MRLLLVNQTYPPDVQATGQYLASVAEALALRGHDVTVATGLRAYDDPATRYPAREVTRGVTIARLWHRGCGDRGKLSRLADFASFLLSFLAWGFVQPRFDVVVTLTTPPLLSVAGAVLAGVKLSRLVSWMMDVNPDEAIAVGWLRADSFPAHIMETLSRWSLRRAGKVMVLDEYMRERIVAKGVASAQIVTAPLWMDRAITNDEAGRDKFREEHGLKEKFVVMYSGNHTPCHPLDTLVEAARLCREDSSLHFCFIGGGLEWARLREVARDWRNTTFLRYQPFAELAGVLSAADLQVVVMGDAFVGIVHPSKVYNIIAARRPVLYIGPSRSPIADLILAAKLGGCAFLFRHGESAQVAERLQMLAFDQQEIQGENSAAWPSAGALAPWTEGQGIARMVGAIESGAQ